MCAPGSGRPVRSLTVPFKAARSTCALQRQAAASRNKTAVKRINSFSLPFTLPFPLPSCGQSITSAARPAQEPGKQVEPECPAAAVPVWASTGRLRSANRPVPQINTSGLICDQICRIFTEERNNTVFGAEEDEIRGARVLRIISWRRPQEPWSCRRIGCRLV